MGESRAVVGGGCNENVCLSSIVHYSEAKWRAAERFRLQTWCNFSRSAARLTAMPLSLRDPHVLSLNQSDCVAVVLIISPDLFVMIWKEELGNRYFGVYRPSNGSVYYVYIVISIMRHTLSLMPFPFQSIRWWINYCSSPPNRESLPGWVRRISC